MNGLEALKKVIEEVQNMSDSDFLALYDSVPSDTGFSVISEKNQIVNVVYESNYSLVGSSFTAFNLSDDTITRLHPCLVLKTDERDMLSGFLLAA